MPNKGWKYLTDLFCLGLILLSSSGVLSQDCTAPDVPNGSFAGQIAEGGNAAIICNTGYEGGASIECQGGVWTSLPSCTPKPCPDQAVANGDLTGELYYEGSATVICDPGYEGGGAAECGASNAWVTVPTCTPVDCGDPRIGNPDLVNSDLIGTTLFDGTAYFECHDGYEGSDNAECLDTGDWGTLPTCSPKDCGTPTTPNGGLTAESTTVFDGTAIVECHEGYEGGGDANCLPNADWDTLPLCTPVDCEEPVIDNGGLAAGSQTVYNGLATVECDVGYEGGGTATCLATGSWDTDTLPTCTPVDCGPPDITNGNFDGDTFYTGSASVTCDTGYDGSGIAFCSTGALWAILPDCTPKDCGQLTVPNGVFSGDTVYAGNPSVACNAGYDFSGVVECGSDGNWATPSPACDPKDCGDPRVGNPDLIHSDLFGNTLFNDGTPIFISCHTGYEAGGTATCLDTGDWGTLPTCNPKDCGTPTTPNGGLTAESTTVFNGTAIVECNEGYEGGGTATCLSNAAWDTLPPCTPVDCGNPTIPNGKLTTGSDTFYSGSATAECDTGYELAGSDVATCLSSGTWDTLPICQPKDCGPLPDPVHGSVSAPVTTYTSVATYTCQSLWQLTGSATLICGADGNWAPNPPTCDDIDCPALEQPTDGSLSTGDVQVGTSVIVSCDSDYTLFGDELIQCETGGTWNTTVGTCRRDCPVLTPPTNGDLSTTDVAEGTVVDITCDTAYTLEGTNQISCLPGGSWTDVLPDCTEDCQSLTVPDHGSISTNNLSQGTVVSIECESGYTLFGADTLLCRVDATWNSTEPTCELDCPSLSPPQDGNIDTLTLSQGTVVTFSCNAGYTLFGDSQLTCQGDSTWDLPDPVCKQDCPTLSHPANGVLDTLEPRQTTVATVSCDGGYTLFGASSLTCQSDATWDFPMPECRQDCRGLTPPTDGTINSTYVTQETTVAVECNTGYTLFGAFLLICQSDATWDNPEPECREDCPVLTPPINGVINETVIKSQGTVVGVECDNAYTLFGAEILTCLSDATWDNVMPDCREDCPILTPPTNGAINTTIESQGTVVGVDCDQFYTLFGDSVLTCQPDANWDTVLPLCKRDCRTINTPSNGAIDNFNVSQESVVVFTCDFSYTLFGTTTVICQSDATWNNTEPTCEKDCPVLSIPNGLKSTTVVILGTVVDVTCDQDYSLEGESELTCLTGGVWNYATPLCTRDCRPLVPPTNGGIDTTAVSQDTVVVVECDTNYTLFGASVLTCQDNAQWDFPEPTCRLDCPVLSRPANAVFSTTDNHENVTVTVSCDPYFTRFGHEFISCRPGGFWDNSLPTCRRDCGLPADLPNGRYAIHTDTLTGSTATYSCDNGYILVGDPDVTCLVAGTWEASPTCRIIPMEFGADCYVTSQCITARSTCRSDGLGATKCLCAPTGEVYSNATDICLAYCGFLTAPTHGYIILPEEPSEGENVTYTCDPGFALSDVTMTTRTCLETKQWSGTAPLCVVGCSNPPKLNNGHEETPDGMAAGRRVYYTCNSGYRLVGETFRECLPTSKWNGNTPVCAIECGKLGSIDHGIVDLSTGYWDGSVATYYCEKDYALVGTATRICQPSGDWTGVAPDCIYAIFPDVLLVIGSLLIFLVIIDIFVVLAIIYMRYSKKKKKDDQPNLYFDDLDEPPAGQNQPPHGVPPVEGPETGMPPMSLMADGPARSSFRQAQNIKAASGAATTLAIPQIPKLPQASKEKKSLLNRIPKPKPLMRGLRGRGKRPKFYGPEAPIGLHATPRTFQSSATDEFADVKIAEMERYLKDGDDLATPSSSDFNRRSTADEEKVSIEHLPSSRLTAGDKMVLMDFDGQDEIPATRLEEPPRSYSGPSPPKGPGESGWDSDKNYPIDSLRPHTPIFPHQRQSEV